MIFLRNATSDSESTAFVYSGLDSISSEGREYLKNIAQSLIVIQNRPGATVPESISQEIIRNQTNEVL